MKTIRVERAAGPHASESIRGRRWASRHGISLLKVLGVVGLLVGGYGVVFASSLDCELEVEPVFHTFNCAETTCDSVGIDCELHPVYIPELPDPGLPWYICKCELVSSGTCVPVARYIQKQGKWYTQIACFNDGCQNPAPCGGPLSWFPPICPSCP